MTRLLCHVFFSLFLLLSNNNYGQKAIALFEKGDEFYYSNTDSALFYYKHSAAVALQENDTALYIEASINVSNFYFSQKRTREAKELATKCIRLAAQITDYELLGQALNNAGVFAFQSEKTAEGIAYLKKAIAAYQSGGLKFNAAQSQLNLASRYSRNGLLNEALTNGLKALKLFEQLNTINELAITYSTIGGIYLKMNVYDEAQLFFQRYVQLKKQLGDEQGLAKAYNNTGYFFEQVNQLDSAIQYYNASLKLKQKLEDITIANTFINLGRTYRKDQQFDSSKEMLNQALQEVQSFQHKWQLEAFTEFIELAATFPNEKLPSNLFIGRGNELMPNVQVLETKRNYIQALVHFYDRFDQKNKLIRTQQKLLSLEKEMWDQTGNKALQELKLKYDIERKEANFQLERERSARLQAETQTEKHIAQNRSIIAGSIALLLLVLLVGSIKRIQQKNLKNQLQVQKNIEDHHRTKNFLQTTIGLFRLQMRRAKNSEVKSAVQVGHDRLNTILILHKMLNEDQQQQKSSIELNTYLNELIDSILEVLSSPRIKTHVQLKLPVFYVEVNVAMEIGLILNETVTNAFKYALTDQNPSPELTVLARLNNNNFELDVIDNGDGIPKNLLEQKRNSAGLNIIFSFAKNLKTKPIFENKNGTHFRLNCRLKEKPTP